MALVILHNHFWIKYMIVIISIVLVISHNISSLIKLELIKAADLIFYIYLRYFILLRDKAKIEVFILLPMIQIYEIALKGNINFRILGPRRCVFLADYSIIYFPIFIFISNHLALVILIWFNILFTIKFEDNFLFNHIVIDIENI